MLKNISVQNVLLNFNFFIYQYSYITFSKKLFEIISSLISKIIKEFIGNNHNLIEFSLKFFFFKFFQ